MYELLGIENIELYTTDDPEIEVKERVRKHAKISEEPTVMIDSIFSELFEKSEQFENNSKADEHLAIIIRWIGQDADVNKPEE